MKLSDIRGERSLDIIADAMELIEMVADDDRFKDLVESLKGQDEDDAWRVFCRKLPPILRDQEYRRPIVSILAAAADVPYDEYAQGGEVLKDLFELVTSDAEALGFFVRSATTRG